LALVPGIVDDLRSRGVHAPVIVGGIIPDADRTALVDAGVAAVYTPKDFELSKIMREVAELAAAYRR
jgi:(2R)-ethylmalonyl-CoA mutase